MASMVSMDSITADLITAGKRDFKHDEGGSNAQGSQTVRQGMARTHESEEGGV